MGATRPPQGDRIPLATKRKRAAAGLAADLARHKVAVIVAPLSTPAVLAAKAATTTIPIVFGVGEDPVKLGLVASLARSGGNATGINFFVAEVATKRLGLLRDLVPKASLIGFLVNPNNPAAASMPGEIKAAGHTVGQQIEVLQATTEGEIDAAFAAIAKRGARGLVIGPGPTDPIRAGLVDIIKQAAEVKLPTLGICLGYQAIGLAFGAKLVRTHPTHGKRTDIEFSASRLLPSIAGQQTVMRYHSLSLTDIDSPLRVVARTSDGIPMALEHESLSIAGFQFHPDSYGTENGRAMITSFFEGIK